MKTIRYNLKCLVLTVLPSLVVILYLNVKYFPGRNQMLTQLNEQLNLTHRNLQHVPGVIRSNAQLPAKKTLEIKTLSQIKPINDKNKERTILCVRYIGGLGNNMFLYASTYGLARLYNMDFLLRAKNDLRHIFNLRSDHLRVVQNYSLCKGAPEVNEKMNSAFNEHLTKINFNTSFWIIGYLQSYKYFESYSDDLRSQFTFKRPIQEAANSILLNITSMHVKAKGLKKQKVTLIGVHNRRGDMVDNKYGYNVATKEYFQKAMDWFRFRFPNSVFVVCSNGMPWSKENMKGDDVYFVENNSREIDFAVLASSDHLISSVGSFGWWAGWLCKGTVIYFFPPAKEGSGLRRAYTKDYSDYFLPKWIPLT